MARPRPEQIDVECLPKGLREIADLCGVDCMLSVWQEYGGGYIVVPCNPPETHPIFTKLGQEFGNLMIENMGGGTLNVPKFDLQAKHVRQIRDAEIRELKSKMTAFERARKFGLTVRHIYNIDARDNEEALQNDLFVDV